MKKRIPNPLWVSIVALGLITLLHVVMAFKTGSVALFVSVAIEVALIVGLVLGHKWAYIVILVFAGLGVAVSIAQDIRQGLAVLVANAVVVLPMVLCTKFFFPKRDDGPESEGPQQTQA